MMSMHAPTPPSLDEAGHATLSKVARWLAHQRAAPIAHVEATAWSLFEDARTGAIALDGPRAPLVVQPRFSLWLVGQLGGRALLRVLTDHAAADATARSLGQEMGVPVVLVAPDGGIAERIEPELLATPTATSQTRSLRVERHGEGWAVRSGEQIVATAPTRERARQAARALRAEQAASSA